MDMRIYLSGPMSGLPDSNFPAFHDYAARLRARGFDVVNPAELNPCDPPVGGVATEWRVFWNACMRADLKAMMDCQAIALMPGWERSKGAQLELHIAHRVGMEVLFVADLLAMPVAASSPPAGSSGDVEWLRHQGYTTSGHDVLTVSAGSPMPPAWAADEA